MTVDLLSHFFIHKDMKKLFLTFIMLLLVTGVGFAQINPVHPLSSLDIKGDTIIKDQYGNKAMVIT